MATATRDASAETRADWDDARDRPVVDEQRDGVLAAGALAAADESVGSGAGAGVVVVLALIVEAHRDAEVGPHGPLAAGSMIRATIMARISLARRSGPFGNALLSPSRRTVPSTAATWPYAQSKNCVSFLRPHIQRHVVAYLSQAFTADPAGWVHPPVSACPRPQAARRLGLAARGQARRYWIIARKDGSRVTLWTRYGTNFTDKLPKVAEAVCSLAADSALIDGEAVTLRSERTFRFWRLAHKGGLKRASSAIFSMNDDPVFAVRAIEAGAKGYIAKSDDPRRGCSSRRRRGRLPSPGDDP